MGRWNKRKRQLAAARGLKDRATPVEIVEEDDMDSKQEYDVVDVDIDGFLELLRTRTGVSKRPVFYSGDSERTKRRKRAERKAAAELTGQSLFDVWKIQIPKRPASSSKARSYNSTRHSQADILTALELIVSMCDALKSKRRVSKGAAFSLETPYDTIRVLAVRDLIRFLSDGLRRGVSSRKVAETYVCVLKNRSVEWFARSLTGWADYFITHKQLPVSRQGKCKKTVSFVDDEDIQLQILAWLRSQKPSQRTALALKSFLGTELEPDTISVSESTARRWLNKLCFTVTDTDRKKGSIYVDGHEREDVVAYRTRFCERWATKYSPRFAYFEGENMDAIEPDLPKGVQKIVPVFHDEATFRANEDQRFCRLEENEQVLKPKSAGRGLMVSEFVCPCHGRMEYPNPCRVVLHYGKNYDGYWTGEHVAAQLRDTHRTFQQLHPDCIALYIFDNSANHHKIASDALNARKLNLKDGGKNTPLLRDGFFFNDSDEKIIHPMQTEAGIQKGLRRILQERKLWVPRMSKAAALELLLQQPDFHPDNLKSILNETVKDLGAWIDFVPKFHPEFNFIEMYWGYAKRKVRQECDYEWESLLNHVPLALDSVPLVFMRRAYTKSVRYIDAYRSGLTPEQVEVAVKKFKSHRRIPQEYLNHLQ